MAYALYPALCASPRKADGSMPGLLIPLSEEWLSKVRDKRLCSTLQRRGDSPTARHFGVMADEFTPKQANLQDAHAPQSPSLTIKASDIDPLYVEAYDASAKYNDRPAEISNMPAEALQFPDNTLDISFANFVVFLIPDEGVPAIRERHQTLKPRGTAVSDYWIFYWR
ncbi:hypothetical protein CC80DRAFT_554665 [Byssothecium circinans]|uniref:Methyltransferase type 11 domain-containing protein n=1 Tax=Byssothecium circinans TaxID=147558 RepID=A0A6A5TD70_9PLEO|nr:hypothetical protein CC80DRAFT_554665 [Byssothecium circinans]